MRAETPRYLRAEIFAKYQDQNIAFSLSAGTSQTTNARSCSTSWATQRVQDLVSRLSGFQLWPQKLKCSKWRSCTGNSSQCEHELTQLNCYNPFLPCFAHPSIFALSHCLLLRHLTRFNLNGSKAALKWLKNMYTGAWYQPNYIALRVQFLVQRTDQV